MDRTMYDHIYTVDLNRPLKRINVGDILASGDEKANRFEIAVCRDGENVDLSGVAAYGYFIRPNEETFKIDGTAEGNLVRVELSKSCYVYDGAFSFAVKLTGNGITQTIAVFDGRIVRTTSENIVDGDRVFYNLEDLLAQIAAVETATKNANTATDTANTATARANNAASAIENATASATGLAAGAEATVEVTNEDGAKHFHFGIPKGEKGDKGDPGTIENVTITSIDGLTEALAEKSPIDHTHTAAEAGAAPVGYGLGDRSYGTKNEDLNEATACGWYAFTASTKNIPFSYGSVIVSNRYGSQVSQMAFNPNMGGRGEICVRHFYDGSWSEWEYINPPMALGVEYRTTERYDGKAVYTKLINFGTLPNASNSSVNIGVNNSHIIYVTGLIKTNEYTEPFPAVASNEGKTLLAWWISGAALNVKTLSDLSKYTAMITIKYTKD